MARRPRKPLSSIAWLLGAIISVSGAYIVYQVRVAGMESRVQQKLERTQAAIQKIQQQQQARRELHAEAPSINPEERARQQVAARLRQAELAAAARAKEKAWERFYLPPNACIYPESDQRADVCHAWEGKARQQFEDAWASGQLQTQR
ncbi:hypothetical protein SAMN05216229_10292 [Geopseudomonas sagittaria]|uniref:Uncharacterized protein n=1 Tax=Geopseudomonas sagittaria TaxID=1135990 RepID=A0A1I5PXX0_9GAMM|nr:hypothetical protein [Pseudomonas sagittaria]SFP38865.1 hypothetical protein SAMN05216229_10292 [Pseudomonas sagittaria]